MQIYLVNFIGNCLELFIIVFFMFEKYNLRFSKKTTYPIMALLVLLQFANTNLFLGKSYFIIAGSLLFSALVLSLYEISFKRLLVFTLFVYAIIACAEIIVTIPLSLIVGEGINQIQCHWPLIATTTISSKFVSFVLIIFTRRNSLKMAKNNVSGSLLLFLLPMSSLLVMILFLACCFKINEFWFQIMSLITSVILAISNIIVFYVVEKQNLLVDSKEKLIFTEKQISNQISHYSKLYGYQNELRAFRHDIKNKYISIIGLLHEGKTEEVINTLNKDISWLTESKDGIVNSGNPVIDAVLQSKMQAANDKDISVNYVLRISEDITIDEIELGIILGNAMDNAIEESERIVDPSNRKIDLRLLTTNGRISINVKNSISSIKKDLTTSKPDKMNHGFGLSNIKSISQKYDGVVNTEFSADTFELSINIVNSIR